MSFEQLFLFDPKSEEEPEPLVAEVAPPPRDS